MRNLVQRSPQISWDKMGSVDVGARLGALFEDEETASSRRFDVSYTPEAPGPESPKPHSLKPQTYLGV